MTPASDVFALLRAALEAASIRYAIGGSWASTAFGEPRFTNDVDILADFTLENAARFLAGLPATFFADPEGNPQFDSRRQAVQRDLYADGLQVRFLSRRRITSRYPGVGQGGLDARQRTFRSPRAVRHARGYPAPKLHWFRLGGEVSEVQWRDIQGIVRNRGASLDRQYLALSAEKLGIEVLLERALASQ